ncbi:MAG: hypothetical protein M9945_12665 [Aquamicrobium sp.]|uniref:hypothetical protein n=1 Tax=Aquamicrobium sp. TaxID=1872579 RepID=UPI00349E72CE|nr:hypothetical protein [Aquamicrobium sp.]
MIFGDWSDRHDRSVDRAYQSAADHNEKLSDQQVTNFHLVGIRRRLNNIEVGVWLIVILLAADIYRNW